MLKPNESKRVRSFRVRLGEFAPRLASVVPPGELILFHGAPNVGMDPRCLSLRVAFAGHTQAPPTTMEIVEIAIGMKRIVPDPPWPVGIAFERGYKLPLVDVGSAVRVRLRNTSGVAATGVTAAMIGREYWGQRTDDRLGSEHVLGLDPVIEVAVNEVPKMVVGDDGTEYPGSAEVRFVAPCTMRPTRIIVEPERGCEPGKVLVSDIRVSNVCALMGAAVPIEHFSGDSFTADFPTMGRGVPLLVAIRNRGQACALRVFAECIAAEDDVT